MWRITADAFDLRIVDEPLLSSTHAIQVLRVAEGRSSLPVDTIKTTGMSCRRFRFHNPSHDITVYDIPEFKQWNVTFSTQFDSSETSVGFCLSLCHLTSSYPIQTLEKANTASGCRFTFPKGLIRSPAEMIWYSLCTEKAYHPFFHHHHHHHHIYFLLSKILSAYLPINGTHSLEYNMGIYLSLSIFR